MRELISDDGRYLGVQQSDGNFVIYQRDPSTGQLIRALWDSQSHEAKHGIPEGWAG